MERLLRDYINHLISNTEFVERCRTLYYTIVRTPSRQDEIEMMVKLPIIHELFAVYLTDSELRTRAEYYLKVLEGEEAYSYTCFIQLEKNNEFDDFINTQDTLSEHQQSILIDSLRQRFCTESAEVVSLHDVLHNAIFHLCTNIQSDLDDDDSFNYVNCPQIMKKGEICGRLLCLLSYYTGKKPFFVQFYIDTRTKSKIVCIQ